jgi:hypothetical protein
MVVVAPGLDVCVTDDATTAAPEICVSGVASSLAARAYTSTVRDSTATVVQHAAAVGGATGHKGGAIGIHRINGDTAEVNFFQ